MTPRLASRLLVQALIRRTEAEGGFAAVLHKGDPISGALLLSCPDVGHFPRLFERISGPDGIPRLEPVAQAHWGDEEQIAQYIARRRKADPDLWVIELDIPNGERLAVELLGGD